MDQRGEVRAERTRLSCHRFVANRVRLSLFILAYNLGNFRRLCLPKAVRHWSLRSVQVKLIKMGGRLVRHSRRLIFASEVSVPRRLFQGALTAMIVSAGYRRRQVEYNHDFAKGESAPGSRLVFNRLHPIGGGPKTTKMDNKHGSRQETQGTQTGD